MAIVTNNNKRYVHVKDIPKSFLKTKRIDPKSVSKTIPDEFKPHVITLNRRLVIDVDYLLSLPGVTLETLGITVETTLVNETTGQSVSVDNNNVSMPVPSEDADNKCKKYTTYLQSVPGHPNVWFKLGEFKYNGTLIHNFDKIKMVGTNASKYQLFFNVRDIENMFGINNIRATLMTETSSYVRNYHYFTMVDAPSVGKFSSCESQHQKVQVSNLETKCCSIWLSYRGLIKLMNTTRIKNPLIEEYLDWLDETVFTHQFGTQEQRIELAKELVGVNYSQAETLLSGETPVPGVYLFHVGDNKYKFGRSNNIMRRFSEHSADYGPQTRLVTYARIERYFIKELDGKESLVVAEDKLKELLKELRIKVDHRNELIECDDVKEVLPLFSAIRKEFGKTYEEVINEYEHRLKDARYAHEIELIHEKHKYELMCERHKNEIKDKDIEILTLRLNAVKIQ